jgi:hypothetical protein
MQPPDDLLDLRVVCAMLGGSRPINAATLYRGAKAGRHPKPIKIGPNAQPMPRRMKAAEVALPFVHPKLSTASQPASRR